MLKRVACRAMAYIAASVVLLGLGCAAPAEAADEVNVTIKIFNYSPYEVRLTGKPVRYSYPVAFEAKKAPPTAKGQQTILEYPIRFSRSGRSAASDSRLIVEVFKGGRYVSCFVVLAYGRAINNGLDMALGTDSPTTIGCEGVPVEWQTSQNDIEVVIDRRGASWAAR